MTFVQSAISFGGYTFPAGFRLDQRVQDNVIEEVKIPFLDGTSAPASSRDSKKIHVVGTIGGWGAVDSSGAYIGNRDQAEAELNLMYSYLESGYQQLKVGATPARYIYAQKIKSTAQYEEASQQQKIDVDITFLAQDPRWLATATSSIGGGTSIAAVIATSNGSSLTYPKFTFSGAYTNPTLTVYPGNGTPYITCAMTLTMVGGDTLVVDCDPRNRQNAILYNGNPRLDILGTAGLTNTVGDAAFFPYLLAGANKVNANGSVNGTSVTMTWQDAYLF